MILDETGYDEGDTGIATAGEETAITVHPSGPPAERDDAGRFARGHAGRGGRPAGKSITGALRRLVSPEDIAKRLIQFIADPTTPKREWLEAIKMVTDRLDGKAVTTSVVEMSVERAEGRGVPAGFYDEWTPEERASWVDARCARQVRS